MSKSLLKYQGNSPDDINFVETNSWFVEAFSVFLSELENEDEDAS